MLIMIESAIRATERGRDLLATDLGEGIKALMLAQEIMAELLASVRPEVGTAFPGMIDLYEFVFARIADATSRRAAGDLDAAVQVLREILGMWGEAIANVDAAGRPAALTSADSDRVSAQV